MPLPNAVYEALATVADEAGDFTLMGLFVNPVTGEMGTFASHPIKPGAVLAFLERSTATMIQAMKSGQMEALDETAGTATEGETTGGNYVH